MKVRIIDIEGTPAELMEYQPLAAQLQATAAATPVPGPAQPTSPAKETKASDVKLEAFIHSRAGDAKRAEWASRFVNEVLGWGTTEYEFGQSKHSADGLNRYIRLYNSGPRYLGAFAYVTPGRGRVNFRLDKKDAADIKQATFRGVKPGTGYEVDVELRTEEDYKAALTLAKRALALVLKQSGQSETS